MGSGDRGPCPMIARRCPKNVPDCRENVGRFGARGCRYRAFRSDLRIGGWGEDLVFDVYDDLGVGVAGGGAEFLPLWVAAEGIPAFLARGKIWIGEQISQAWQV